MNLSFACSGVTDLSHLDGYVWVHGAGARSCLPCHGLELLSGGNGRRLYLKLLDGQLDRPQEPQSFLLLAASLLPFNGWLVSLIYKA